MDTQKRARVEIRNRQENRILRENSAAGSWHLRRCRERELTPMRTFAQSGLGGECAREVRAVVGTPAPQQRS